MAARNATVAAQTLTGEPLKITGETVRCFVVHKAFPQLEARGGWKVTHVKSGLCFPWQFWPKRRAISFAREVAELMDWDAVEAGRDPKAKPGETTPKGIWLSGAPTKAQTKRVVACARRHEAIDL